ncbi:MAG: hypothetical protein N2322_04410 [Terrimicrobiaceae bacterium]|nr:hypothetical protein [Terrimicrobiaceae bacterium]
MRTGIILAWVGLAAATARGMDGLDPAQWAELRAGKQVVITRDIPGQPWPEVTVYQLSPMPPEEVAAVFFDYESARSFVPNVLKSSVQARLSPREADVDYILDVPVLPDEEYTARNTLSRAPGGGYSITWRLLKARHTKSSIGEFLAQPSGGGSLLRYRALTTPGAAIAGLLRARAVAQMREALGAICREALRLRDKDPAELGRRVGMLREALGPEPTS